MGTNVPQSIPSFAFFLAFDMINVKPRAYVTHALSDASPMKNNRIIIYSTELKPN